MIARFQTRAECERFIGDNAFVAWPHETHRGWIAAYVSDGVIAAVNTDGSGTALQDW